MNNNINLNVDAKTSHLVWGVAIHEVFRFLPFVFLFTPALAYGLWMFGNLSNSVSRESEFDARVEACTQAQLRVYGRADSITCRKSVNAEFRVYENL
jgi:hypothetical protein